MTCSLWQSADSFGHIEPSNHHGKAHPENRARVAAILAALPGIAWQESAPADWSQLCAAHDESYLEWLEESVPERGIRMLDADTFLSPESLLAAQSAAGLACAAVDAVLGGTSSTGFCLTRPPGHHAGRNRSSAGMGFCLYNNIAVAAQHARAQHGIDRIAIVDFDVHHGNGTQDIFWNDVKTLFISSHEQDNYPFSGASGERGAHGQIHNFPLPAGSDGTVLVPLYQNRIAGLIQDFEPELLLISAGFDGHRRDPLGGLALETDDFAAITRVLRQALEQVGHTRIVSCLEGGYDCDALAESVLAHIAAL